MALLPNGVDVEHGLHFFTDEERPPPTGGLAGPMFEIKHDGDFTAPFRWLASKGALPFPPIPRKVGQS